MKKVNFIYKVVIAALVLLMAVAFIPTPSRVESKADVITYTLDATNDIEAFAAGAKVDGDVIVAGTDNYFTVFASAKTKVDASNKTFADGYSATQRINFGGKSSADGTLKNLVKFSTTGASTVKIWWVAGGDNRQMVIWDSAFTEVAAAGSDSVKNALYINEFDLATAGDYYIAVPDGSNYLFKAEVGVVQPVITESVLDVTTDVEPFAAGAKADGDVFVAGTDNYFTVFASAKMKIDGSTKTFDDGYYATQRINFGGTSSASGTLKNLVKFETKGVATVKIWWVSGGDKRQMAIWDSAFNQVAAAGSDSVKNALYINEFDLATAGDYYIAVPDGSNYLFKVQVTDVIGGIVEEVRKDWASVAAPAIVSATDGGNGEITVVVDGVVGDDGGDALVVEMYDAKGGLVAEKQSLMEKESGHSVVFAPATSGTYTFKARLVREDCTDKYAAEDKECAFVYPLAAPVIGRAYSAGNGSAVVVWDAIHEASSYNVYVDGKLVGNTTELMYTCMNLTVGSSVEITVEAVREAYADTKKSEAVTVEVTQEAETPWGFTRYGSSTDDSHNGYIKNENGSVTVYSEGGKGKIVPNSTDGVAFYYTPIEAQYNFTLRATVTVDSWTLSNGQEGFGLMAADRLGVNGDGGALWNNSYMALASKVEYWYMGGEAYPDSSLGGRKYTMKLGLGSLARTGITKENLDKFNANDTETINKYFISETRALETLAGRKDFEPGTFNIIGNHTLGNKTSTTEQDFTDSEFLTSFVLEIQKNNTGYFVTYYAKDGSVIERIKYYDTKALEMVDEEYVYAGFFAARNARATFSDIVLETILPENDAPAEERPITYVDPVASISSAGVTTSPDYELILDPNVNGVINVKLNGVNVIENLQAVAKTRIKEVIKLSQYGENLVEVDFLPDPDQDLGEYTELKTLTPPTQRLVLTYNNASEHRVNIYVTPDGAYTGNGTREYPYDIATAIKNVLPGQTIILCADKNGSYVYLMEGVVRIERGMDGTEAAPIRMIADPEATERPVFDFNRLSAGIVHGGNYWYFNGFDVTNTANAQKGFQVSGNYNVLEDIVAHHNGNTGIQISRLYGSDLFADWPHDNLILNCTSYANADAGHEDADGFAAKLTVGEGNIFDGCIAYNNSDDGWDLYAKVETGSIGTVVIKNCVTYGNGYLENGKASGGNGNGFKMGGDSLSGKHIIRNCISFNNRAKGIDSNSGPDTIVENCISYNNGGANFAFYTNNAANTDYKASGNVSFKDAKAYQQTADNLKPKGTQVKENLINETNYFWNGTASANSVEAQFVAAMFESLTFTAVTRNADGTINMGGFLALKDTAPQGVGTTGESTPSNQVVLGHDHNCTYHEEWTWDLIDVENDYHWHECECGFKLELGKHNLEWIVVKEATPTEYGKKVNMCTICGYKGASLTITYNPDDSGNDEADGPVLDPETEYNKVGCNGSTTGVISMVMLTVGAMMVFVATARKKQR